MAKARTVADVILGEAASGSPAKRYADMKAIASVIANRAKALGVSPQEVVSNRREFNAYGKSLPAGVGAYRSLAQRALDDVATNGPSHGATFYATPKAAGNLPKGLKRETATTGHVYYSDPQNRAIGTSLGYRQPRPAETATQAIAGLLAPSSQPTTVNERMGLLNSYAPQPEAAQMAQNTVPTRSVKTTSYYRPEPQASLDTLRQQQPASPQDAAKQRMVEALNAQKQQLASGGLLQKTGRLPQQADQAGLLSQDVSYQGLINGLNAQKQQLQAGVNPMDEAAPWKQPTQPTPMVDVPQAAQVDYQPTASVAAPSVGVMSSQPAPRNVAADNALARQVQIGLGASKLLGGMGGGLLGGMLLGPAGALAGGLIGRSVGAKSYYPPAPESPNPKQKNSEKTSRAGLSGAGREIYDRSAQVRSAIDSGKPGLY